MRSFMRMTYSCSSSSASSSSVLFKLFCVNVILLIQSTKAVIKLPPNVTIPAVFAFGDSIMDTGNNNHLRSLVKCDFPPYGQDFQGRTPTGRFCNGKVPSDFIVEELGIKEYLPAYSSPFLQPEDLVTGVCFASGGSGYDPLTPKLVSVISLSDQLKMFKEYIKKLKGIVGEEKTKFILANSLFTVVAGSNDIANTYFVIRVRQLEYDVNSYTDLMVNSALSFYKELYEIGARRIAVFSAPPIGCMPSQKTLAGGEERMCAEDYNKAAILFNKKLSSKLDSLSNNLPNSKFVYIDVYNPLLDLIQNPKKYGFEIANEGCCGTGEIEVAILCNHLDKICSNASKYVFWDSYHPTEQAYKTLIAPLIENYVNRFF